MAYAKPLLNIQLLYLHELMSKSHDQQKCSDRIFQQACFNLGIWASSFCKGNENPINYKILYEAK